MVRLDQCATFNKIAGTACADGWSGTAKRGHEAWLAWNVSVDNWYDDRDLSTIDSAFASTALDGAEAIKEIVGKGTLRLLRVLTDGENAQVPSKLVNHVTSAELRKKYDVDPWAVGTAMQEAQSPQISGDSDFEVTRKLPTLPIWITFESGNTCLPTNGDEVAQNLGLCFGPKDGDVLQIFIPKEHVGALYIPTFFDGFNFRDPNGDWRAVPEAESQNGPPWGYARNLNTGEGANPELIASANNKSNVWKARRLPAVTRDWNERPYLSGVPK